MKVVGLILAGGEGQRLGGVRKADLRLSNRALWRWAAAALADQCDTVLISTGSDFRRYGDLPIVLDAHDGIAGPCAGLLAAARWCASHAPGALMVSTAVDCPFFPPDFVSRALALLGESGAVVAAHGAREYPVTALWRSEKLRAILEAIPPAPRGPRARDVLSVMGSVPLDYARERRTNPFAGINTLGELLAISRSVSTKS